jgi:4-hydroxybenzoate polyprenyltransferase
VKRTKPVTLLIYAIAAAIIGWFLQTALSAAGAAVITPPVTLAILLTLIGAVVVVMAIPVRRAVRDRENHRVDPFYATRVVVLAKASSIAGSLIFGATIAITVYLLTRTVVAGVGSIFTSGVAVLGSVILLVCGLIGENMCSIPPDDRDKGDKNDPATKRPQW